jgi:hypothetical protein
MQNYYEEYVPHQNSSMFKSHFRVSPTQFEFILNRIALNATFTKKNPQLHGGRHQICAEKALLITLWTLATPESYREVGDRFNVSKLSVFTSINIVISVILQNLCPHFITWPNDAEKEIIAVRFSKYGLPNVIGAIDGSHIPIKKPEENGNDYYNREKYHSLVLQAICTPNLMFIDCDVRWPGSVHDGRVFRTSDISYMKLDKIYVNQIIT